MVTLPLSSIQASVCFIQLLSSRLGKSSRACAPRLSVRFCADSMVTTACAIRLSNSSVSIRSVFQISERSVTLTSCAASNASWISFWPSCSTSPVRNTAQLFCITFCICIRSCAVGVLPLAWRNLSSRESARSAEVLRQIGVLFARRDELGAAVGGGAAEHHEVDQRVGAEPVGAVHRHAGGFAERHQAGDHGVVVAVLLGQRLAVIVRRDAAHIVVHGRHDRDRLARQVDAGEDARGFRDAGQPLLQHLGIEMIEVQEDVVLELADAAAFADFDGHGARHHVARGEVLGGRRIALHEALALAVDEIGAFAARAFGDQDSRRRRLPVG